jgi:hypothetical protein
MPALNLLGCVGGCQSSVAINPPAELIEIVHSSVLGNIAESAGVNVIMKGDAYRPVIGLVVRRRGHFMMAWSPVVRTHAKFPAFPSTFTISMPEKSRVTIRFPL